MKTILRSRAESGQAIVLIALMLVALIGITGLAIDGGSLLLLERRAQKVADLAAMGAATASCVTHADDAEVVQQAAARDAAQEVGIANEVDIPTSNVTFSGDDVKVQVYIPKTPYFIQLVYRGGMTASASSTVRCTQSTTEGDGFVLFGTSLVCGDAAVHISGHAYYINGHIWSNTWTNMTASPYATVTGNVHELQFPPYGLSGGTHGTWPNQYHVDGVDNLQVAGYPYYPDPHNMDGWITESTAKPAPAFFKISDFRPGGKYSTDPLYHNLPSIGGYNFDITNSASPYYIPREGIIYVNGDFTASGSSIFNVGARGLTIAVEGKINFSGVGMNFSPYTDGLALFANAYFNENNPSASQTSTAHCYEDGVVTGSVASSWSGLIYTPATQTNITMSDATSFHGAIIANRINISVNSAHLEYEGIPGAAGDPELYYVQ